MDLSDRWTLRLLAVGAILFTAPEIARILHTGELYLNVFHYTPVDDVIDVFLFVSSVLYLAWSFLMARLEAHGPS